MKYNEKIVALRKANGFTQEGFARAVGVTRQAVYKWEVGDSYPEAEKLIAIKQLFGISIDDLLDDGFDVIVERPKKAARRRTAPVAAPAPVEAPAAAPAAEAAPATVEAPVTAPVAEAAPATVEAPVVAPAAEDAPAAEEAPVTAPAAEAAPAPAEAPAEAPADEAAPAPVEEAPADEEEDEFGFEVTENTNEAPAGGNLFDMFLKKN